MPESTVPGTQGSDDLDWIHVYERQQIQSETSMAKLLHRAKLNPFVPIGCCATVCALGFGLYNFMIGDRRKSQLMMRARVGAQAFTVVAAVVGVLSAMSKNDSQSG